MIRRIKLVNVRKHVLSEYFFTDEQLIMFAGPNGSGKSTILEAVFFAFYGQTRHGRRGIAEMVNREGWHEGMEVEVDFVLGSVEYSVKRRFEKGKSTAVLKAGDSVIMQGADEVSAQVGKLFGVDANGFRLAAVTRQKDVQGLLDMTSSVRVETVGKILKLTELKSASKLARGNFRKAQAGAEALLGSADIPALERELADVEEQVKGLESTQKNLEGVLGGQEKELAELTGRRAEISAAVEGAKAVVVEWQEKVDKVEQLRKVLGSSELQFKKVEVVENIGELNALKTSLSLEIAQAVNINEGVDKVLRAQEEIGRLEEVADGDVEGVLERLADKERVVSELNGKLMEHETTYAGLAATLESIEGMVVPEGVCYACGQDVEEDLHSQLEHDRKISVDSLGDKLLKVGSLAEKTRKRIVEVEREVEGLREMIDGQRRARGVFMKAQAAIGALKQSIDGLGVDRVDVGGLYEKLGEVEGRIDLWRKAQEDLEYNRQIGVRRASMEGAVEVLSEQVAAVDVERVRERLVGFSEKLSSLDEQVKYATGLVAQSKDALGTVGESLVGLRTASGVLSGRLQEARVAEKLRGELVADAEQWSGAAGLLEQVAGVIGQQHRPKLELRMTELLNKMSAGRFDRVKILADYGVEVADVDGNFYPVSEFSGGEGDLIALALRLSLASTLGNRTRFVILDEVFGSQDDLRREAIIEGLRGLANEYSQILLISHVGGMDEVVDRVVEL